MTSAPTHANVIFANAFEAPTVAAGNFAIYHPFSQIGPWRVHSAATQFVISGSFSIGDITYPALEGPTGQWLDLTGGNSGHQGGVWTNLPTEVGRTYSVTFSIGNLVNAAALQGQTSTVEVYANSVLVHRATNSSGNANTLTWQQFEFEFSPSFNLTTLLFVNADPLGDNLNGLDGVIVRESPPAVPEASSAVLLGLGLAGLGLMIHRRGRGRVADLARGT